MQDRRRWAWTHRYAVPMFMSSLVAVLLSGSGLIAVLVFANGGNAGLRGDDNSSETSDQCAPGKWNVTEYTERASTGSAELVEGTPVFTFSEDGTGVADFPAGTTMTVNFAALQADVGVHGQITYQYEESGETLEFVDQDSTAEFSSDINILGIDGELTLPEGPLDYTCDGNEMTFTDGEQAFDLQRAG